MPDLVGLTEGLGRRGQIAHPHADRPDLVEALSGDGLDLPADELVAREARLLLGARETTAQRDDLRAVDAADARETAHGLTLAPAMRRVGPVARATKIGDVAARADRAAVHDASRHEAELAADGGHRRLVDQAHALARVPGREKDLPAEDQRE